LLVANFSPVEQAFSPPSRPGGGWEVRLDTADERWGGPGADLADTLEAGAPPRARAPWSAAFLVSSPS
jgi:hypothetical protein